MSLKEKLAELAKNAADAEVRNKLTVSNTQNQQIVSPVGKIVNIDTGTRTAVVQYPDKSTESVALGGDIPLGIGTVVRVSGGKII